MYCYQRGKCEGRVVVTERTMKFDDRDSGSEGGLVTVWTRVKRECC
jgi:hypothetical protein